MYGKHYLNINISNYKISNNNITNNNCWKTPKNEKLKFNPPPKPKRIRIYFLIHFLTLTHQLRKSILHTRARKRVIFICSNSKQKFCFMYTKYGYILAKKTTTLKMCRKGAYGKEHGFTFVSKCKAFFMEKYGKPIGKLWKKGIKKMLSTQRFLMENIPKYSTQLINGSI